MPRRHGSRSGQSSSASPPYAMLQQEDSDEARNSSPLSTPNSQPLQRNRLPLVRRRSSKKTPREKMELGDPSAMELQHTGYPLQSNAFVQRAVQFYVKYYAPSANQRPHFIGVGQDLSLLRQYIPFILHDGMVFSAVVAMASLGANIAATGDRERSSQSLKYYQLAVSMLRQRLTDESQRSSDAVIATLSNLCGFETLIPADGKFTYPKHPFDPELCSIIAEFPRGITDLALSGELSNQIITLISYINKWDQDINNSLQEKDIIRLHYLSHNSRNITLCGEFLHQPNLPLVEQLVILALLGFCYSNDYTRAMYWLTNAYLQVRCRFLNSVTVDVTDKNEDFITWIGTVLAATSDPGSQPWTLGLSLLEARPTPRDWQANVKLCETFFWNESMSLRLSSKIGYLRQKSRQGQG
ncbi:hypothetical protein LTR99_008170 [Exophiala xenobiotica]|uniref:Transcription factor domain-containing protein n=1 Tax=Vermiconidia calcicola TaxID=1690605 RepID=A0AAV9QJ65_9PEZI|nr:hypothetical protein LTR96_008566 [Exophiala xenobiotica]KAK5297767.1 hypothetical protein LTR99_008170 [Exophiala xenobiotica]KAK5337812.1 hypothetical protein LTR98_005661 [Exophiala xenobiotica]KAK5543489.1 hypothetical protein LTR25_001103 [Vermiconidia calcicola]KAK5559888.1 hypothetical protein LTR46_001638 [Exophiala xenobiotica]